MIARILGSCCDIFNGCLAGLRYTALSLCKADLTSAFRKAARDAARSKLNPVSRIVLTDAARRFKEAVLDAFLGPASNLDNLHIRTLLRHLAPGGWRQPLWDIVLKDGQTIEDVIEAISRDLVPTLYGHCPYVYPSHRWSGMEKH